MPAPQVEPVGVTASKERSRLGRLRAEVGPGRRLRNRRVVVTLFAVLLVVYLLETIIGGLMHQQRQYHLASQFRQPRPVISSGQAVAVLQIPKLGVNEVVVEDDSSANLRAGPGHRTGTPAPGEPGNSLVTGHRQRFGGPFAKLDKLAKGDEVYVQRMGARSPVAMKVASVQHLSSATVPFVPTRSTPALTLVTSGGGWLSSDVVVVTASADGAAPAGTDEQGLALVATPAPVQSDGANFVATVEFVALIVSAGGLWLLLWFWVHRDRAPMLLLVVLPVAIEVLVLLWLSAERLLPATL